MLILLFTTVSCPNCPQAKRLLKERNISFLEIDAGTPEGLALARKHHIASVPTVIVVEDQDKALIAQFSGAREIAHHIEDLCSSPDSKK